MISGVSKIQVLFLMCSFIFLGACEKNVRVPIAQSNYHKELEKSIEQNRNVKPRVVKPPSEVTDALLPPINVDLARSEKAINKNDEPRFDITADDTNARAFFMSLVTGTPYNMVVHPSLTEKISLSLKNVTVDEVMKTVHHVYGYEYRRTQSGYEVLPAKIRTKIFKVNYLNVTRTGSSNISVSAGQVSNSSASSDTDSTDSTKTSASSEASKSTGASGGSQMTTTSESNFWASLQSTLESMIGEEDGRKVVINPQTGIIIVRAMPNELRIVDEYLNATQNIIQRQVILEAKILEIRLNDKFKTGINWSALGNLGTGKTALFGQTGGGSVLNNGFNPSAIEGNTGVLDPNNLSQVEGTDTSAFGGIFSVAVNANDFTAFIELMEGQGDVQVLSSPRISTVNNQKAVIKVGQDEFFVTDVGTDTTTNNNVTNQTSSVTLAPFFSGVALDVIPQIDENDTVTLYVHPSVSEVTEILKDVGQAERVGLATSSIRESDSIVRVQSGQVVVIGGLMQNLTEKYKASVPGLGNLPVVGSVFGHREDVIERSELVILLRPIVIKGNRTWTKRLEERKAMGDFTYNK
jgi:MSHA biogenesis protein MshL